MKYIQTFKENYLHILKNKELKAVLFKLYSTTLQLKGYPQYTLKEEAFMRGVFLDEKTKFKKGTLLHWYEFTDPFLFIAFLNPSIS